MRHSSDSASRGFSLVEVLAVVAALGLILYMSAQLFFPMRRVADRQRLQVEARQTARSAADYVAHVLRGTTDLNSFGAVLNTGAILTYLYSGQGAGGTYDACPMSNKCVQVSYNNVPAVVGVRLADPGTDLVTVTRPTRPVVITATQWNGHTSAANAYWGFDLGCPDPIANRDAFYESIGVDPDNPDFSQPLIVFDESGNWQFYQIDVKTTKEKNDQNNWGCDTGSGIPADCDSNPDPAMDERVPCIWVVAQPAVDTLNAPGGQRVLTEARPHLALGLEFVTMRVCQGWLETKAGIFNPATDKNCPSWDPSQVVGPYQSHGPWTPLLPNVEDLQFTYLFANGDVRNSAARPLTAVTSANCKTTSNGADLPANVPCQGAAGEPYDISQVLGFRVTVTGRSSTDVFGAGKAVRLPLVAEDHDPGSDTGRTADKFYRFQVSADALIRNRSPRR